MSRRYVLGILVGGAASRMGGVAKGLLRSPRDDKLTLVEALASSFAAAAPKSRVVLLGNHAAYRSLRFTCLDDHPAKIGPLGGLGPLLEEGRRDDATVVLTGCDLPYVDARLFERLLSFEPALAAIAPSIDGRWEPLFSRVYPEAGTSALTKVLSSQRTSLQSWLNTVGCIELPLTEEERAMLRDWDSPTDVSAAPDLLRGGG